MENEITGLIAEFADNLSRLNREVIKGVTIEINEDLFWKFKVEQWKNSKVVSFPKKRIPQDLGTMHLTTLGGTTVHIKCLVEELVINKPNNVIALKPTNKLRWFYSATKYRILQQQFIDDSGNESWFDVEEVVDRH